MIKNFHNGKAIKKYKKKIKKQAKIINGLLDFLEKLGYDKKRWAYWEKNGRREYTSFSIPNDSNLIKITIKFIQWVLKTVEFCLCCMTFGL